MDILSESNTGKFMHLHSDSVADIRHTLPDETALSDLSDLFKIFGDSTRIRILFCLRKQEMCVNDIAALLGMTTSAISHQLSVLKKNKLIRCKRLGKAVLYSLADNHVSLILDQGIEHISE